MKPNKFVEPDTPNPRQQAEEILRNAPLAHAELDWLLPGMLNALEESEPDPEPLAQLTNRQVLAFEEFVRAIHQIGDLASALVYLTRYLESFTHPTPTDRWDAVLIAARERGHDLLAGLARLHALATSDPAPEVLRTWMNSGVQELGWQLRVLGKRLSDIGAGDFSKFVRWGESADPDYGRGWGPQFSPSAYRQAIVVDPREPAFWLHAIGESAVAPLAGLVTRAPQAEVVESARCFVWVVSDWMTSFNRQGLRLAPFTFFDLPTTVRVESEYLYTSIEPHLKALAKESPLATPLQLRLARIAFEERSDHLTPEFRRDILQLASRSISKLRPLLRESHTPEGLAAFTSHPIASVREDGTFLLFEMGSLWDAWKPLLLAFRALSSPSLSPELSFVDNPPQPWWIIPSSIVMMFHHHARKEQATDPSLSNLRSEFGQLCLDSLKTAKPRKSSKGPLSAKDDDEGPTEASPEWRFAFIRALVELRINPEGDGHRVLFWAQENDPDEGVQEAAKKAYNEVRRGDRLGDMSPRRAILRAFWWLEQAHMLALGQEVDGPGAQRTRELMLRATT